MRECPLKVYLSSTHSKGTSAEALTMWTVTELCPYFLFSAFHGAVGFLGILWNSYTRSHTTAVSAQCRRPLLRWPQRGRTRPLMGL